MSAKILYVLGKVMYVTGLVILLLSAYALFTSPILIFLGGQLLIIIPGIGVVLYVAGKWMTKGNKPLRPITEKLVESSDNIVYANMTTAASMQPAASDSLGLPVNNQADSVASVGAQNNTPRKNKRIKKLLITFSIVAAILLFNFPLLHMLEITRRLHSVDLPLSNQRASMGGNGLVSDRTNLSFAVDKMYPSSFEAKNDIARQLKAAGIATLQPTDEPAYIFLKDNGATGGELPISEIEMIYENDSSATLSFKLQQPITCTSDPKPMSYDYLCEGEVKNDALKNKLINSRPISSVTVRGSVKF